MDALMSIGDIQGRLCLIKRVNWLVYGVMAALVGIALVAVWLIFQSNSASSEPIYRLHARVLVANPLPRTLDAAQLSIKLPSAFEALLPDGNPSIQVQRSGSGQQLLYTPANFAAGSRHEVALDISLLAARPVLDEKGGALKLAPHGSVGVPPAIIPFLSSDDVKGLDDSLLNAVNQAKSLADYQEQFVRLDPAHLVTTANVTSLSQEQIARYAYLLGLMAKSAELKQTVSLFSGWVFDPQGHGSYQIWAESGSKENRVRWPSAEHGELYLPTEQMSVSEFIVNPRSYFNPVTGFGLDVEKLDVTLQKQK